MKLFRVHSLKTEVECVSMASSQDKTTLVISNDSGNVQSLTILKQTLAELVPSAIKKSFTLALECL